MRASCRCLIIKLPQLIRKVQVIAHAPAAGGEITAGYEAVRARKHYERLEILHHRFAARSELDYLRGVDQSEQGEGFGCLSGRQGLLLFKRRSLDRDEHVQGYDIHIKISKSECHLEPIFPRFTQADNTA